MKYRDRMGNEYEKTTKQDEFLAQAYSSAAGRGLMKFLSLPLFSKCAGVILSSRLSAGAALTFAEKNNIDMSEYEERMYSSFNDFFTRKLKPGKRWITTDDSVLISPCDGKVSAYEITVSEMFVVKNSVYTVDSLLRDSKLAKRYSGGTALIIRLSVDDCHRYCYCADGVKSRNRRIEGMLYTVNPVINRHVAVYKENSREYCMIRTKRFGDIIQMEVGATMVGRIANAHSEAGRSVSRGEEKGFFEFGGSTIILLVQKNKVNVCKDLLTNTRQGFETKVRLGEMLGVASENI
ncbi:phosphatidylserine decarboxylase [Ruminococcus sp. Marseille-P6503]|uniref:phosphatidylserine decarboxylase n=1 Tax=Ruminococcus sp. Marseille-P6503 TaxID=2364796 RepID=UPI000F51D016|nr:phosphatidylserine decarboxylase [Ruminococcus sp. Marseille-P6503]